MSDKDNAKHRLVGGMTCAEIACGAPKSDDGLNATRAVDRVTCDECLAWRGFD